MSTVPPNTKVVDHVTPGIRTWTSCVSEKDLGLHNLKRLRRTVVAEPTPEPNTVEPRSSPLKITKHSLFLCRYLDTFQQGGLLLARDLTHLDHDVLVSLGITATGHRKRILRLVSHVQRSEGHTANETADLNRGQSVTEWRRSVGPGPPTFQVFRNSSTPNLAAMLTNSGGNKPGVKPVPKPRTVFNRRRTVPVHFSPDLEAALPPRRVSQDYICFQEREALSSEKSPSAETRCEGRRRTARSWSLSAAGPITPPVPPRISCGLRPTMHQDVPSSLSSSTATAEQNPTFPEASCPRNHDNNRLSGFSPSGSPKASKMEMVSNEIYWGTLPAPPTPPRQAVDLQRKR